MHSTGGESVYAPRDLSDPGTSHKYKKYKNVMSHIRRLFQKRQKMFIPLSRAFIRLLFYSSILLALSLKFTANSKVTACAA